MFLCSCKPLERNLNLQLKRNSNRARKSNLKLIAAWHHVIDKIEDVLAHEFSHDFVHQFVHEMQLEEALQSLTKLADECNGRDGQSTKIIKTTDSLTVRSLYDHDCLLFYRPLS